MGICSSLFDDVPQHPRGRVVHREQPPLEIVQAQKILAVLHQVAIPVCVFPKYTMFYFHWRRPRAARWIVIRDEFQIHRVSLTNPPCSVEMAASHEV
jgi:hypothetical protein